MPKEWKIMLQKTLSNYLEQENIPKALKNISLTLIHIKGFRQSPSNYRDIALVNSITKLFTLTINKILQTWTESYEVLPEAQSGFRKQRTYMDNLFVLD